MRLQSLIGSAMLVLLLGLGVWVALQYAFQCIGIGRAMLKEAKFFGNRPTRPRRMARAASGLEVSQGFLNMAKTKAYRSQAEVLKVKRKSGKKRR